MIQQVNTILFENTNPLDEQTISIPLMGKISLRQLGIVFVGLLASIASYHMTESLIILLILIVLSVGLGLPRPKILPMDKLVYCVVLFLIKNNTPHKSVKKPHKSVKKPHSEFMGLPGTKIIKIKKQEKFRNVFASDFTKHKRLHIKLLQSSGVPLSRKFVRVFLDDELLNSLTTDGDGLIEVSFIPQKEGPRKLKIISDDMLEPLLHETILVKAI